jgi:hypothetical protein
MRGSLSGWLEAEFVVQPSAVAGRPGTAERVPVRVFVAYSPTDYVYSASTPTTARSGCTAPTAPATAPPTWDPSYRTGDGERRQRASAERLALTCTLPVVRPE